MLTRHYNPDNPALANPQPLRLRIETIINYPAECLYTCPMNFQYFVNDKLILSVDRPVRGKWLVKNEITQKIVIRRFKYLPRPLAEYGDLALDLYARYFP